MTDRVAVAQWLGRSQGLFRTPFALRVGADYKHPDRYILTIWQGGLGLPNRDYYLKDDARFAQARAAYNTYLQTLLRQIDDPDPAGGASEVFAFEQRLAQAQWEQASTAIRTRPTTRSRHASCLISRPGSRGKNFCRRPLL